MGKVVTRKSPRNKARQKTDTAPASGVHRAAPPTLTVAPSTRVTRPEPTADVLFGEPPPGGHRFTKISSESERRIALESFIAGANAQEAGQDATLEKIRHDVAYCFEGNEGTHLHILEKAVSAVAHDLEALGYAVHGNLPDYEIERGLIIAHNRLRSAARLHKLLTAPRQPGSKPCSPTDMLNTLGVLTAHLAATGKIKPDLVSRLDETIIEAHEQIGDKLSADCTDETWTPKAVAS